MIQGWVMAEAIDSVDRSLFRPYTPYVLDDNGAGDNGMYVWAEDGERVLILREGCAFLPRGVSWWVIEPDGDVG